MASARYAYGVQKNFILRRPYCDHRSRESPPPRAADALRLLGAASTPYSSAGGDSLPCLPARRESSKTATAGRTGRRLPPRRTETTFRPLQAAPRLRVDTTQLECPAAPSPAGIHSDFAPAKPDEFLSFAGGRRVGVRGYCSFCEQKEPKNRAAYREQRPLADYAEVARGNRR